MTWVIKIIYEHDDSWKLPVNIQSVLNDEMVEVISDAGFDMRVEVFKGLLSKIDKELKNENT